MRGWSAAVALCLSVIAVGSLCVWALTLWNLRRLGEVPPLSWDAVALVWVYAAGFTAIVVLVLIAVAVALWLAEAARSTTTLPSTAPTPPLCARPLS
jgi:TRAP-type C4-dicarboxylate transport system permease small subunit